MPIHFRCPHCAKLLALATRQAGTQIHCPLCAQRLTVPRRTEVNLPTTTVMPPEGAQSWWMDAPPLPAAPADAWWLTPNAPPTLPENAHAAAPQPNLPPPLPEGIVSPAAAEPAIDPIDSFTRVHLLILLGGVVVAVAIVGAILLLIV